MGLCILSAKSSKYPRLAHSANCTSREHEAGLTTTAVKGFGAQQRPTHVQRRMRKGFEKAFIGIIWIVSVTYHHANHMPIFINMNSAVKKKSLGLPVIIFSGVYSRSCRLSGSISAPIAMKSGLTRSGLLYMIGSIPFICNTLPPASSSTHCAAAVSHSMVGARRG